MFRGIGKNAVNPEPDGYVHMIIGTKVKARNDPVKRYRTHWFFGRRRGYRINFGSHGQEVIVRTMGRIPEVEHSEHSIAEITSLFSRSSLVSDSSSSCSFKSSRSLRKKALNGMSYKDKNAPIHLEDQLVFATTMQTDSPTPPQRTESRISRQSRRSQQSSYHSQHSLFIPEDCTDQDEFRTSPQSDRNNSNVHNDLDKNNFNVDKDYEQPQSSRHNDNVKHFSSLYQDHEKHYTSFFENSCDSNNSNSSRESSKIDVHKKHSCKKFRKSKKYQRGSFSSKGNYKSKHHQSSAEVYHNLKRRKTQSSYTTNTKDGANTNIFDYATTGYDPWDRYDKERKQKKSRRRFRFYRGSTDHHGRKVSKSSSVSSSIASDGFPRRKRRQLDLCWHQLDLCSGHLEVFYRYHEGLRQAKKRQNRGE